MLVLLLLPLGVWRLGARQKSELEEIALAKCRTILKPWQHSPSVKAGHPAPVASLSWLHASATGVVPTLSERESIRQQMDALNGIQCPESGVRHLRVLPHLAALRDGTTLHLSGEVSDAATVADAVNLLIAAEPGLKVTTTGVTAHPAVLPISLPRRLQEAATDPFLARTWQAIQFAWPPVTIDFDSHPPRLLAKFPDKRLRDAVIAALRTARPDLLLQDTAATLDPTLPPADLTDPATPGWQPPVWLKDPWEKWNVYPALRLRPDGREILLDGTISSPALLKNVLTLLHRLRPGMKFDRGRLTVRDGSLAKPLLLPASLIGWTPPAWLRPVIDELEKLPSPPPL